MSFTQAVTTVFQRFSDFKGRSRRSEYWWFAVFSLVVGFVAGLIDLVVSPDLEIVGTICSLALLIPSIAVGIRRLHDVDRTGWWVLLAFIPIFGWIVLIWWFSQKGTEGPNRFGADPTENSI